MMHCSAGVGRTGTIIMIDIIPRKLFSCKEVDIVEVIKTLRNQRASCTQLEGRYVFVILSVLGYIKIKCPKYKERVNKSDSLYIRLRVAPLPNEVVALLEESAEVLKSIRGGHIDDKTLTEFKAKLLAVCEESLQYYRGSWWYRKSKEEIAELVERIWCFGPGRAKVNILINGTPNHHRKPWDSSE
ncbi:unnamed protein product [Cylicocyclus nassatus]|uniref:Uncharacterized protein n=1 Tax=Cylicocyclus nassatus TaxID=53992 RepID=A0AA36MDT7_CYLNA|nr:unnamed protein product [Cylicocyclus nassatus]